MRSLVGMSLSLFCVVDLETSNCLMPAAGELAMLNKLLIMSGVLARAEAQRVYGAARESHNELTSNTRKHCAR